MSAGTISRRSVVTSGALAGTLALAARWPAARAHAAPGTTPLPPATGTVALWTRVDGDSGATFRLAQLDAAMLPRHELAVKFLPPARISSIAALHRTGLGFLRDTVARSWRVRPENCWVRGDSIGHPDGQSVRFIAWTDIA